MSVLSVDDYQKSAQNSDRIDRKGKTSVMFPLLGLAGEIGSLLAEIKKDIRDQRFALRNQERIKEEIGDIIWYVNAIASRANLRFKEDILLENVQTIQAASNGHLPSPAPLNHKVFGPKGKLSRLSRKEKLKLVSTFSGYQDIVVQSSRLKSRDALLPFIIRIWSHSSDLLTQAENTKHQEFNEATNKDMANIFGNIMWHISNIAHMYNIEMNDVAAYNIDKVQSRWPGLGKVSTPLFDDKLPSLQQFPREFTIHFIPRDRSTVQIVINDVVIGDPLTDNSSEIDGYRYHDVFHLACIAVLGWSPVFRAIMKRKRKIDPKIDQEQDGARARIVEEAIWKIVHSYAQETSKKYLLAKETVISFDLLKEIKMLTRGLEVEACKFWEWEVAILEGFKAFNLLRDNHGGSIAVNMKKRTISYSLPVN